MPGNRFVRLAIRRSVSSLMLLVALSAVSIVAVQKATAWKRVRDARLVAATSHAKAHQLLQRLRTGPSLRIIDAWDAEVIRHHRNLEQKYLMGAARPWQPMPPDPPSPRPPTKAALEKSMDEMFGLKPSDIRSLEDLKRDVEEFLQRGKPKRLPWKDEKKPIAKPLDFI